MDQTTTIPLSAIKGRGAATRIAHRFASEQRDACDDGWGGLEAQGAAAGSPLRTEVIWEEAKSAIVRQQSPDIYFEQSITPYRGCEHGCIYCFARPTHSYLNLSPGLDFQTKLIANRNITEVLPPE